MVDKIVLQVVCETDYVDYQASKSGSAMREKKSSKATVETCKLIFTDLDSVFKVPRQGRLRIASVD